MNKIFMVKWNKSRRCWSVCSELGRKNTKKGIRRVLTSTLLLVPSLVFANDVTVERDAAVDFGTADQTLNTRIDVTNGAEVNINAPADSLKWLTIGSGSGLTVSDGTVRVNGKLGLILKGTGFLNVSGPDSELYIDNFGNRSGLYTETGGIFNVSNGGKVNVKERINLDYEQGSISGAGSQVNAQEFFLGNTSDSRGNMSLSVKDGGELNVSKKISLGYYDQNSSSALIVANKGKISAPEITLGTNSELALGGREGEAAQAAGIINADKITFVWAPTTNKKITLNHTDNNAVISADILSGSAGLGHVNALSGTTWLTGDNSAFSGAVDINNGATIGITQNLGTADITNNGQLQLNASNDMVLDNNIDGGGLISVNSGNVSLSGNNAAFHGAINVDHNAAATVTEQQNLGTASLSIDGKLQLNGSGNWVFNNNLAGSGVLGVNTGNNSFRFANGLNASSFTGTVALQNTIFNLENTNTDVLKSAALSVGSGSHVNVGAGEQSVGSLTFDGGVVNFGAVAQGADKTNGQIQVTNRLDISGNGVVQVSTPTDVNGVPQVINSSLPLLELDDGNATIKLVDATAGVVVGDGGGLQLQDASGQAITSSQEQDIIRNGSSVARGTYDFRLTSGAASDGLYIGYGLTQLDLLASGTDALTLDANGKTGNAADMSAHITGSGDLAFSSQKGETVSLSNQNNDYTGITDIRSGNLLMKNDNVLGKTSEVRLATNASLDMNGHSQTAGKLNSTAGSILNIDEGSLTLTDGGLSAGTLTGRGFLNVNGGVLNIIGANSTLKAETAIANGAVVQMDNVMGLGSGSIDTSGTLSLSHASGSLGNNLSGAGNIALVSSDTVLSGNNGNFSGQFLVDDSSQLTASGADKLGSATVDNRGTLVLNSATDWQLDNDVSGSGNVRKTGIGSLVVSSNAAWTGQTDIDEGSLILGKKDTPVMLASSQVNIAEQGTLSGFGGVAGNLTNSGTIVTGVKGQQAGNVLTVGGNYTGNNGLLLMNTVLEDDNSATDKLIIKGNATGYTRVAVTNAGGAGAQTLNGIELIRVDGNADSANFVQTGRIAAGAYDYTLGRGQGANSGSWYLTSGKNTPEPTPDDNDLRPEAGSYTANIAAANNMFVTRLHERQGQMQYTDVISGEQKNTSMWMRHEGGHNRWRENSGQLKTQSNRYVLQLGGDIAQWGWNDNERWHLGVMAGYGNDHNSTDSIRTGYRSKGNVNGYSTGLYATWYANDETHNGAYLDTWAQYSWFDNHVKGDGLHGESWKSKGLTASLETGYTWRAGEFTGSKGSLNEWYVQPQAQVVWMGVKADEHHESNGTRVESTGDGNIHTRLGVKTWIKSHNKMDEGKSREFSPFVEVNWLHNTRDFGTRMNGVTTYQNGARNIGEVKAGIEGQINSRLNLWGNVGVQVGDKGYSDASAMMGVKYTF